MSNFMTCYHPNMIYWNQPQATPGDDALQRLKRWWKGMSGGIITAILVCGGTLVGVLAKACFDFVVANRVLIKDLKIQADSNQIAFGAEWRTDNITLRAEIAELKAEVLRLRADVRANELDKVAANAICDGFRDKISAMEEESKKMVLAHQEEVTGLRAQLNVVLMAGEVHDAVDRERTRIVGAVTDNRALHQSQAHGEEGSTEEPTEL